MNVDSTSARGSATEGRQQEIDPSDAAQTPLVDVLGLRVSFRQGGRRERMTAVDGVDLRIAAGSTLGLVGESGSGKSTIGNAILGLVQPDAGAIIFDGRDIAHAGREERRALSRRIQVVFQDPYGSFNPSRTVGQAVSEPWEVFGDVDRAEIRSRVGDMLTRVGLRASDADCYPVSFSGGQRQRIAVARALITGPELVVCDEAVSALDLSTQAQVLNLLRDLQQELGLTLLFISHDLSVVRYMSHEIVVLYRGRVVERGAPDQIYDAPSDPFTRRLVHAALEPDPARRFAAP